MVAICTVSTQSSTSQTGQEDCVGQLCAWSRACGHTSKTASKTSRNEWIVGRGAAHTHARCREMKITNDYERTNEPASQRADGRSRHQLPISATTTMYDRSQFGPKRTGDDNVSRGPHLSDRPAGQSGILSRAEQGRAGLGRAGPVGRGCVARAMAIAGESSQLAVRLSVCLSPTCTTTDSTTRHHSSSTSARNARSHIDMYIIPTPAGRTAVHT